MELATNLFSKGLLMDTNPMVQGNETLTDCLNGTLITMNGNEVILLNDMGNRRVNDAFLPSGYEPVGMKEYGGVIYIAAYNPITNKSQIGSFPSPLRKIDTETTNEEISFDFGSFFPVPDNSSKGKFLLLDSFLIPLTKENMHAGDKFSIWSSDLSTIKSDLTNYENIVGNKAFSPKNRKYTIKVGILNSLNLFVDITKTLSRWEEGTTKWELKKYILGVSDVYKFNDGYFIPDEFDNENLFEGIEDAKLIKHRQKLATNTYSYKLIGPLYLNIKLNHIENFNYDILGTYDEKNKKAKLKITSYIIYNCPDGVPDNEKSLGNQDYDTFEEGLPTFSGFDLREKDEEGDLITESPNKERGYTTSTYNVNTNTYLTKITKYYDEIEPNSGDDSDIFEYFLGVLADSEVENVYLKGISEYNSIDLSLLGSGIVKIYGWKFYNNIYEDEEESESNFILNIYSNAYPEPGTLFKNLRFKFKEITSSNETTTTYGKTLYYPYLNNTFNEEEIPKFDGISLNNGKTTLNINYKSIGLEKNKLYEVKIYYDIVDEFSGEVLEFKELGNEENVKRWVLTTTLFNSFFNNPTIKDFSIEDSEEFKAKMDFSLYVDDNITSNISDEKLEVKGSLISENKNIRYYLEHKNLINIKVDPKMKIANPELYPDILLVNSSVASGIDLGFSTNSNSLGPIFDNGRIKVLINGKETSNDVNDDFISELSVNKGDDEHNITFNQYSNDDPMFSYVCNVVSNKLLNISCVNLDAFEGYSESPTSNINLFSDVSDMALDLPIYSDLLKESTFSVDLNMGYYGGIVFDSEEKGSGHRDLHQLFVYRNLVTPYFNTYSGITPFGVLDSKVSFTKGLEGSDYKMIGDRSQNKKVTFKFSDYEYDIYEIFNKSSKQVFKFCTLPNYSSGRRNTDGSITLYEHDAEYYGYIKHNKDTYDINDSSQYYKAGHLARVWWKAQNGWIMFDDFFDLDTGLSLYFGDSHDTSLSNENIQVKFKNFLDQNFNKKYIYCRYKNITESTYRYYIAKNNFIYNNPYSISVKFSPIYKKLSGNNVPLCSTVKFGNLEFNNLLKNLTNFKSNGFAEIILRSSESFLNRITSFTRLLIEGKAINLYKETGLNIDINGEYLKENKIYYIENGQIYPTDIENDVFVPLDITLNSESTTNKLYALTFSKMDDCKLENYPVSRYDFLRAQSNADGNILLDYKGVHSPSLLIVKDPVFNYGNFGGNRATSSSSQTITTSSSGHFGGNT